VPRSRLPRSATTIGAWQPREARRRFAATVRWRRTQRINTLRRFVNRSADQRWSPSLLRILVHELGVGDEFFELVGDLRNVPRSRYPQVVAVALALRYSYREDLLREFFARLRRK
jgi:hypothetical protein